MSGLESLLLSLLLLIPKRTFSTSLTKSQPPPLHPRVNANSNPNHEAGLSVRGLNGTKTLDLILRGEPFRYGQRSSRLICVPEIMDAQLRAFSSHVALLRRLESEGWHTNVYIATYHCPEGREYLIQVMKKAYKGYFTALKLLAHPGACHEKCSRLGSQKEDIHSNFMGGLELAFPNDKATPADLTLITRLDVEFKVEVLYNEIVEQTGRINQTVTMPFRQKDTGDLVLASDFIFMVPRVKMLEFTCAVCLPQNPCIASCEGLVGSRAYRCAGNGHWCPSVMSVEFWTDDYYWVFERNQSDTNPYYKTPTRHVHVSDSRLEELGWKGLYTGPTYLRTNSDSSEFEAANARWRVHCTERYHCQG
ncbi:hypothetical protein AAMO2058_001214400 [Amorphochlora amoebiformis]|mmetsp:Transcript_29526/g.47120  ORF Transcript_29526/g.47120 Transcript_29526/m.47120 type:complete len:363 (-) Transcript_29526:43-1131(-)